MADAVIATIEIHHEFYQIGSVELIFNSIDLGRLIGRPAEKQSRFSMEMKQAPLQLSHFFRDWGVYDMGAIDSVLALSPPENGMKPTDAQSLLQMHEPWNSQHR